MILQDVFRYDDPPHAEVVWLDEASGDVISHGYPNAMMARLRAVLGAAAGQYEGLIAELEATCPAPSPAALRQDLIAALSAEYERRMAVISGGYTLPERESWHVQTAEARALLSYEHSLTPWINSAAAARGIDRVELARRIAAKDDAYRAIHGALTGARQRIEDAIYAAGDDAQALQQIDVRTGWPGLGSAPAPV